jgi:hypothetical protein
LRGGSAASQERRCVTTKEIPKRELRVIFSSFAGGLKSLPTTSCYNKRNPKKGIESVSSAVADPLADFSAVTTKEIPNRELRDQNSVEGARGNH